MCFWYYHRFSWFFFSVIVKNLMATYPWKVSIHPHFFNRICGSGIHGCRITRRIVWCWKYQICGLLFIRRWKRKNPCGGSSFTQLGSACRKVRRSSEKQKTRRRRYDSVRSWRKLRTRTAKKPHSYVILVPNPIVLHRQKSKCKDTNKSNRNQSADCPLHEYFCPITSQWGFTRLSSIYFSLGIVRDIVLSSYTFFKTPF